MQPGSRQPQRRPCRIRRPAGAAAVRSMFGKWDQLQCVAAWRHRQPLRAFGQWCVAPLVPLALLNGLLGQSLLGPAHLVLPRLESTRCTWSLGRWPTRPGCCIVPRAAPPLLCVFRRRALCPDNGGLGDIPCDSSVEAHGYAHAIALFAGDVHVHIHFDHSAPPPASPPRAQSPQSPRAQPREPASPGAVFSRFGSPASTSPPRGPRMAAAPPTLPLQPMARLIAFDDSLADLVSEVESLSHAAPPAWPQHGARVPPPSSSPDVVQRQWEHFQERSGSNGGAGPPGGSLSVRIPVAQPHQAVGEHSNPPRQCEEKRAGSCRRRQGLAVRTYAREQPDPASAKVRTAASPTSSRSSPSQPSGVDADVLVDRARAGPFPAAPHARQFRQDTLPLTETRRSPIQRVHMKGAGGQDRPNDDTRARPCANSGACTQHGHVADGDGVLLAHAALQAGCAARSGSLGAVCAGDEEDELLRFLNDSM